MVPEGEEAHQRTAAESDQGVQQGDGRNRSDGPEHRMLQDRYSAKEVLVEYLQLDPRSGHAERMADLPPSPSPRDAAGVHSGYRPVLPGGERQATHGTPQLLVSKHPGPPGHPL